MKSTNDAGFQHGLKGEGFFTVEQFYINSPLLTPLIVLLYSLILFLSASNHQDTIPLKADIQLFAQLRIHLVTGEAVLCLKSTGFLMKAAMDNSAVGFGGSPAYFCFLLQYQDFDLVFCQFPSYGSTNDTAADDGYIHCQFGFSAHG